MIAKLLEMGVKDNTEHERIERERIIIGRELKIMP